MIDLRKLRAAKVSDVLPGQLVLYAHGEQQFFAFRVEIPEGDEHERVGLVILCTDAGGSAPEPFLFPEVGHNFCLHIGKPAIAWDGDPTSVTAVEARGVSPLVVTLEGIALVARRDHRSSDRSGWDLVTGKHIRYGRGCRVNNWQIGVFMRIPLMMNGRAGGS